MKHLTKELWLEIPARRGIVSLQDQVEQLVGASEVQEGIVLILSLIHI